MTFSRVICGLTVVVVSLLARPGATVAPPQAPTASSVATVDGQRAFVQQVLRRVPQRPPQERRLLVDGARRGPARSQRAPGRRRDPQGARRPDAAGRGAPSRDRGARSVQHLARHAARRDGRSEPHLQSARTAPPEPPRVPRRGARSAGRGRGCGHAAAARRAHRLVRQHGRRADREPGADAGVHPRRRQGGTPGTGRPAGAAGHGQVRRAEGGQPDAPRRGRALRLARRHRGRAPVPRRRHLHLPERALLLLSGRTHRRQSARGPARSGTRDLD